MADPVFMRKEVAALPAELTANTLYFVRVGEGFDLYLSDITGQHAHKVNSVSEAAAMVPTLGQKPFVVPAHSQALFSEPIVMGEGAWIEVRDGAVLREVR